MEKPVALQISVPTWLNDYWQLILGIITVISFIGWVVGFRPKASQTGQSSYIDCETNEVIETKNFNIEWGHVPFFRKIKLEETGRSAILKLKCKPTGEIWADLPTEYFGDYSTDSAGRAVYIVNKNFYKKRKIKEVSLQTTQEAPAGYADKIVVNRSKDRIEILNNNNLEIRNFPLELPDTITPDKFLSYAPYFTNWETRENQPTIAYLLPVEQCISNRPGKKVIPL
jgi:hypothetical protein